MLKLFGIKLLNDLLLPFDNIRILLVEVLEAILVLKEHLKQSASPLKHFIQSILQPCFQTSLGLWLRGTRFRALVLILSIPDIVSDEFLDLGLLLRAELLLPNLVRAEHLHQSSHILYQDVIASDHYLLLRIAGGLTLGLRPLRSASRSVAALTI